MNSVHAGVLTSLLALIHTGGILWYASRLGYTVFPSDDVDVPTLLWIYTGLIVKAVIPAMLFFHLGLVSPGVLFLAGLWLAIHSERTGTEGEPLGVIYLNLWPYYGFVFLIAGAVEYLIRSGLIL